MYASTYTEAKEKLSKLKNNKLPDNNKKALMSELCNRWLGFRRGDIKESTYIKYRNIIINHISPQLTNACINSLRGENLQKLAPSLKSGGLSNKSKRDILALLSSILKYAEKVGLCTYKLHIEDLYPKTEKKKIRVLPTYERIRLEHRIIKSNNPAEYGILLAIYIGMRIVEICALK